MDSTAEPKWSAELEVALFHSMHGHKPVGKFICWTTNSPEPIWKIYVV